MTKVGFSFVTCVPLGTSLALSLSSLEENLTYYCQQARPAHVSLYGMYPPYVCSAACWKASLFVFASGCPCIGESAGAYLQLVFFFFLLFFCLWCCTNSLPHLILVFCMKLPRSFINSLALLSGVVRMKDIPWTGAVSVPCSEVYP